jgi:hypothetical protein
VKPALLIALLVLVGGGIAAFSVLDDRADQRVQDAFVTPCRNPGDPFVALPAGYRYRPIEDAIFDNRGDGRSIERDGKRVGAVYAYSTADPEALTNTFADGYAEGGGLDRSQRGDLIVLAAGDQRMLVGARRCHVISLVTVAQHERALEQTFF